jgi:regulator of protease activity HflC (stomatin/prohibitin superfamily)
MPADMNDYFKKRQPNSGNNNKTPVSNNKNPKNGNGQPPQWILIAIIAIASLVFLKPFKIINSGEVGIKVRTGKFDETPLKAGLHFYIPLLERIIPVNTRIRLITYSDTHNSTIGDNYATTLSKDGFEGGLRRNPAIQVLDQRGLTVSVDIAVQYRLRAETAPKTIEKWGASWEEKIINSKVREVVRDVIGKYPAEKLPEMRNEIASAIQTKVEEKVNSLDGRPVVLSSVELRNIVLPPKIKEKIEQVQAAKQDVTIAEQQKEKAKQEAQRKAEIARGEAEKKRIEAQGQADKIRIVAEEQAKANKLISGSLTLQLLQLEQIKTQKEFNEALKVNKNAQLFLTPNGTVPNIWVNTQTPQQKKAIVSQQQQRVENGN